MDQLNLNGAMNSEILIDAVQQQARNEAFHQVLDRVNHQPGTPMRNLTDIMRLRMEAQQREEDETDLTTLESPWEGLLTGQVDRDFATLEEDLSGETRRKKFNFSEEAKRRFFGGKDPYARDTADTRSAPGRDLLNVVCSQVEIAVEIGKYLRPRDILNIFIASRGFKNAVSNHLLSSVRVWIAASAPEAGQVFRFGLFKRLLVPDPTGRTYEEHPTHQKLTPAPPARHQPGAVRVIPGIKYLQLVLGRDRHCRQILAILARMGFRTPPTMHGTLLRLWLLMELPTSRQREAWLRDKETWTDIELYNAQFFFVKLCMAFNDPVYGPSSNDLLQLMMGQKGLYPLWQLLTRKRYTRLTEVVELFLRYNARIPDEWDVKDDEEKVIWNVSSAEIGIGHLEGWGRGQKHLMRPDELIPFEAVARGVKLQQHICHMAVWGYWDWETGKNLVPSEEEMYISDEENVLSEVDTSGHWRKKHVLKSRWEELTSQQKKEIFEEDEDERLRAMVWGSDESDDEEGETMQDVDAQYNENDDEEGIPAWYHPDDEIRRGYVMNPPPESKPDNKGWSDFMAAVLGGGLPELSEDEVLRTQAFVEPPPAQEEFDWLRWAKDHGVHMPGDGPRPPTPSTEWTEETEGEEMEGGGDGGGRGSPGLVGDLPLLGGGGLEADPDEEMEEQRTRSSRWPFL